MFGKSRKTEKERKEKEYGEKDGEKKVEKKDKKGEKRETAFRQYAEDKRVAQEKDWRKISGPG